MLYASGNIISGFPRVFDVTRVPASPGGRRLPPRLINGDYYHLPLHRSPSNYIAKDANSCRLGLN